METRKFQALRHFVKGTFVCFAALSITITLGGCSPTSWMPRVQGQLEAALTPSSCELQLADAEDATAMAATQPTAARSVESLTIWQRQRKAVQARDLWRLVGITCQGRFAEGVLESGRASSMAASMARRTGIAYADTTTRIDANTSLTIADDAAKGLALAHDRAGFAFEVLAARHTANGTLAKLSDRHKALASGFAAHTSDTDSRNAVYSAQQLLANPDVILDTASGLRVPTSAAVAMDLVREQLSALATSSSGDTTANGDGSADTTRIMISDDATASVLANLLSEETSQALQLGFPQFDEALFTTRVATS